MKAGWIVAAAVLPVLLNLRSLIGLMPHLGRCFILARGSISLEHNLPLARSRNLTATVYIFIFLLIADRYCLFSGSFLKWPGSPVPAGEIAGISAFCSWLLLRAAAFSAISRTKMNRFDSDARLAVHRGLYNFLIMLGITALATLPLLIIFRCPDSAARVVLMAEMLFFWIVSLLRTSQIINNYCGGFSTFLYLCGLEFIPAAMSAAILGLLQS
ncbi:MAG: hypothetical protein IJ686_06405 [Bacteroidales bacterium]|nr:hypothetical protein [Bacteroidales bacterium]